MSVYVDKDAQFSKEESDRRLRLAKRLADAYSVVGERNDARAIQRVKNSPNYEELRDELAEAFGLGEH